VKRLSKKAVDEEEEMRRLIVEAELLEGTLRTLRTRIDLVENAVIESRMASQALAGVKAEKKDAEVLVPAGGGAYIRARIDDTERVILGVGADVCVEKTVDQALESVEQQISQLEKSRSALEQQFAQASAKLDEDRERLSEIARKREETGGRV